MLRRFDVPRAAVGFLLAAVFVPMAAGGDPAGPPIKPEEAFPTISWKDAGNFLDQEVFLVGKIVRTGKGKTGHVFLNFDPNFRSTATIFINKSYLPNFPEPPDKLYKGKMVRARGRLYEYNGAPNLAVSRPDQITVLPDDTPLPTRPEPPGRPPVGPGTTITIASYNVLNLFDTADDPYRGDDPADAKPRPELEALAASIRALNADVLALQEVENRGYLEQFVRAFLADVGYTDVVLFEGNDARGIDVAVVTRLPVGPVTSHRHVRFPDGRGNRIGYRRDLLQVRLEPAGAPPFDVFVVHFKSQGEEQGGGIEIRLPEAKMTRAVLDRILAGDPQAAFVLCGDFNDDIDSEPLKAVLGTSPTALTAFIRDLPAQARITYNQEPHRSMIDFILASPAMAQRYVPGSYRVIPGSPAQTGSDHNPVVAQFKLK